MTVISIRNGYELNPRQEMWVSEERTREELKGLMSNVLYKK